MAGKLATPVRRTQAERRDESERGVLQAAIAVVAQEGVGAVTFDAVGRKGGFPSSTSRRSVLLTAMGDAAPSSFVART